MSAAVALPGAVREQTARSVVRAAAFLRAGQLASWLWVPVVYGIARLSPVVLAGYLLAIAWTAVLFTTALRRNDLTTRWVLADVAVAVACAVIVSRAFPAGQAASPRNWVLGPICGAGVTCAFFASRWITAWSVAAIAVAWVLGTWPDIGSAGAILVPSGFAVIVVFSLVAALAARVLFRAATQADQAAAAALEAQRREAMAEARDEERRQQFKVLHDNVLHTLESIARGELGIGSQQVRETCMRDADYLRGLITGGADSIPTDLGVALAGMGRDRSALGLRINQQFDALPKQFPPHVTQALTGAAQGGAEQRGQARRDRPSMAVRVRRRSGRRDRHDRRPGPGVRPAGEVRRTWPDAVSAPPGSRGRGKVRIDSAPGEGTSIQMSWTP